LCARVISIARQTLPGPSIVPSHPMIGATARTSTADAQPTAEHDVGGLGASLGRATREIVWADLRLRLHDASHAAHVAVLVHEDAAHQSASPS
jgi:hypothetical protein